MSRLASALPTGRFRIGPVGPKGPVSRDRLGRALVLYAVLAAGAAALSMTATDPGLDAFAFGLMVPGGGSFICSAAGTGGEGAALAMSLTALSFFGAAIFLWFATGNVFGPPLVWLLSAAGAGAYAIWNGCPAIEHGAASIAAIAAAAAIGFLGLSFRRTIAPLNAVRRPAVNSFTGLHASTDSGADDPGELGDADLAHLRFLIDRALQPIDEFEGFEKLDPFQSAALRYQLQFPGIALAILQRHRLPALGAYMTEAQARLIEKARLHRTWRYWVLESAWGRGRADPNPFATDNVMFTGFCASQIALFQAASGDRRFSRPGAFSLRHPSGTIFEADLASLVRNIRDQHRRADFGLIACEPNWLFPVCNSIGYVAIAASDAQTGSGDWTEMAGRQRDLLESEFTDRAGRFVTCRSSHLGLAMPPIGGVLTRLLPSLFLNATLPDLAAANWQLVRESLLRKVDGRSEARLRSFWPVDVGNYRFTRIAGLAGAAATAAELGDREVADAMMQALDRWYPVRIDDGAGHRDDASLWAHSFESIARTQRTDALRRLVHHPAEPGASPHIAGCPYPSVQVARAVALDGRLEIVLRPGTSSGTVTIGLAGLKPGAQYRWAEAASIFSAAPDGTSALRVDVSGRTEITVTEIRPC